MATAVSGATEIYWPISSDAWLSLLICAGLMHCSIKENINENFGHKLPKLLLNK